MLARNETIFKWTLYAAATVLCLAVQGAVLQRVEVWGVLPFLIPLLAAVPASYEGPLPGTVFALALGVLCDLLLPEPLPCFYTLLFPLIGLGAGLLAQNWLPAGILCSLACAAGAFALTGAFRCFLLMVRGQEVWPVGARLCLREFCVTAPLVFPVTWLYRAVFRRTRFDE